MVNNENGSSAVSDAPSSTYRQNSGSHFRLPTFSINHPTPGLPRYSFHRPSAQHPFHVNRRSRGYGYDGWLFHFPCAFVYFLTGGRAPSSVMRSTTFPVVRLINPLSRRTAKPTLCSLPISCSALHQTFAQLYLAYVYNTERRRGRDICTSDRYGRRWNAIRTYVFPTFRCRL